MRKKRILVIDDEVGVTRGIRLNLEELGGYEVRTVNHGSYALMAAREFRPDLVLLDVMMPDIDGGDVAAEFRKDASLKDIPIVFLTAIVSKEETEGHETEIGGLSYLAKPVDLAEMIRVIERHLQH